MHDNNKTELSSLEETRPEFNPGKGAIKLGIDVHPELLLMVGNALANVRAFAYVNRSLADVIEDINARACRSIRVNVGIEVLERAEACNLRFLSDFLRCVSRQDTAEDVFQP